MIRPALPASTLVLVAALSLLPARLPAAGPVLSPDGPRSGFATSVALAGDRAYVGNPGSFAFFPMPPNRPGLVNVFQQGADGSWAEIAALSAPDGQIGDAFGTSVAASGEWVAVGAPRAGDGAGAVHVYRRAPRGLDRAFSLTGAPGEALGTAVALSGGRLYAGGPGFNGESGRVRVLRLDAGPESETTLTATDPWHEARFGAALDARGTRVLVGAPGPAIDPFAGALGITVTFQPGSAHLFDVADTGSRLESVFSPEEETPMGMGWAVALGEDEAFVGAPLANGGAGLVLRYALDETSGSSITAVTPAEPVNGGLGMALAWDGRWLAAGAPMAGTLVLFEPDEAGTLVEAQRLQSSEGQSFFGATLALGPDLLLTGAPGASLFAGTGFAYRPGADGWTRASELVASESGPAPITGEAVPCSEEGTAAAFPCADVDLVAFVPAADLGADRGIMVNDLWGWTDPDTGREYAIVGRNDGTVFVDVTDGANPVVLGELPLSESAVVSLWRDMKVYADHAFIVADNAGRHGMQVFDLAQLRGLSPDPDRVFQETARYEGVFSAHNLFINEDTGYGYIVGSSSGGTTCGGGLHMVDLREPTAPVFAGCFQDTTTGLTGTGTSHDVQCVLYHGPDADYEGREICLGSNETALSIADVTEKSDPVAVSTARYPNSSYVHQGWLSEDQRFFFMNDEGDEIAGMAPRTRTLIWDIQDLDDPVLLTEHLGTTAASDHNLYVRDNLMYQSNYVSGLRILDVSDPANPVEIGYFDTVPQGADEPGFAGSWSNYPFFQSGTIVVTSMREGLFVLKRAERRTVFQ